MISANTIWLSVGFLGQAMFTMRFLIQWISSERQRRSVIPVYFWYFSLAGGLILLAYAVHREDPVFILGQATGVFIYLRNLQLLWRQRPVAAPDEGAMERRPEDGHA